MSLTATPHHITLPTRDHEDPELKFVGSASDLLPASATGSPKRWSRILLVEDDATRKVPRGGLAEGCEAVGAVVQVHSIVDEQVQTLQSGKIEADDKQGAEKRLGRIGTALGLIGGIESHSAASVVVANASYGCSRHFVEDICRSGLDLVVELRPSTIVRDITDGAELKTAEQVAEAVESSDWSEHHVVHPTAKTPFKFCAADAGEIALSNGTRGRLIIAQPGGVAKEVHRGTLFAFTTAVDATLDEVLAAASWTRWIRPYTRRVERNKKNAQPQLFSDSEIEEDAEAASEDSITENPPARLLIRTNITLARRRDQNAADQSSGTLFQPAAFKNALKQFDVLNTVELFAGAGGMGLGFLMARDQERHYRVIYSGEIEPIYAKTLQINHEAINKYYPGQGLVPHKVEAADLRADESLKQAEEAAEAAGGAHILVGGPPCQGFSAANRNSWSSDNPNNQLVDVFLRYVEKLQPKVFLMENVQGILWTSKSGKSGSLSVADDLQRRIERAGYLVFPQLLDAVWYGVPQHRTRYFLLGIHRDLGYSYSDFGEKGPFPQPTHGPGTNRPYVTVRQAIEDLPPIGNGHRVEQMPWSKKKGGKKNTFLKSMRADAPNGIVWDHVTSTHAPYVIERYEAIPEGGNWQDIQDLMTNYAAIERTHSNIYRRLKWDEPTITMGHYRKSMLIHPSQHRGLSLREAMRLQSIPDWFRFAGSTEGVGGGLMHKQQQLANAVCPMVLKAIAEQILKL